MLNMVTQEVPIRPDQIPDQIGVRLQSRQRLIIAAALEVNPQANNKIAWVIRESLECLARCENLEVSVS